MKQNKVLSYKLDGETELSFANWLKIQSINFHNQCLIQIGISHPSMDDENNTCFV